MWGWISTEYQVNNSRKYFQPQSNYDESSLHEVTLRISWTNIDTLNFQIDDVADTHRRLIEAKNATHLHRAWSDKYGLNFIFIISKINKGHGIL